MRFGFNACFAEDNERFVNGCVMPPRVLAGSRIVNKCNAAHLEFLLQSSCPALSLGRERSSYLRTFKAAG
jgi:hypothetical protein